MVVSAVDCLSAAELAYGVKHSAVERRTADGFIHPAVENLRFARRNILPVFVELHDMLELRQGNVKIHHRFYFSVFLFRPAHAVFVPLYLLRLQEVVALHAIGHSVVFVISLAYVAPGVEEIQALEQRVFTVFDVYSVVAVAVETVVAVEREAVRIAAH